MEKTLCKTAFLIVKVMDMAKGRDQVIAYERYGWGVDSRVLPLKFEHYPNAILKRATLTSS